ncbi:MAG: alkylmercury lyase [Calditrichaeota bacterium]|nr:MAG: alkylmercury lyase [Calditrichota bacterium]MBL1207204.1 alkylmercury lyase [Calditrichota bacterium]NOG47037.1 alkylmercury lyase [Calditrichota bacterium]
MNIELYYFEGCPSYVETGDNLKNALKDLGFDSSYNIIEVLDADDAVKKKFLGSPTIRVNGIDFEEKDGNYIFGCRIFSIDGKMTGTPTKAFIKEKFSVLLKYPK